MRDIDYDSFSLFSYSCFSIVRLRYIKISFLKFPTNEIEIIEITFLLFYNTYENLMSVLKNLVTKKKKMMSKIAISHIVK